jgi:hypothetical protein
MFQPRDIIRVLIYFIFFTLIGCSSESPKTSSPTDTTKSATKADTTGQQDNDIDFRQEFISLYQTPILIDTSFVGNDKKYEVIFHHFCTMDNRLIVPAMYNFDTNKDFVTHNFASDLTVIVNKDTAFKKHITKATFKSLLDKLDTPLIKYATLLYPILEISSDSIQIHYSISIPVTDIGIRADIKFDKKGNYVIGQ